MTQLSLAFQTAGEILFGRGKASEATHRILSHGRRVFLVHGRQAARVDWLAAELEAMGAEITGFAVAGEPDLPTVEAGRATARSAGADVVVSIGGGSVIDAGKAIAALVNASGSVRDYLEIVGTGRQIERDPLPFIALPTTAGTGAEVTKNAVIGVPDERRKVSLRDPRMLARLAIIDPALTDNTPRNVTLESGLDAITQVVEPFISSRANRLTDALCRDAIQSGLMALRTLMMREDEDARDQLAWTSLCGGLALANSGLGVVHALAGPLGGLCAAPHGAICGVLLPYSLAANRDAVSEGPRAERIEQVLVMIGAAFGTTSGKALSALANWSRSCGLQTLSQLGLSAADREIAAEMAMTSSSMAGNPVPLDQQTVLAILDAAS